MSLIGIMQGRLSPPQGDTVQSFPIDTWRGEFDLARKAGLDCIEWIYDSGSRFNNPILTEEGRDAIRSVSANSGIQVSSVCADIFMVDRLIDSDGSPSGQNVEALRRLLPQADALGCRYVLLPFVDNSSLARNGGLDGLTAVLVEVLAGSRGSPMEIHLETDLEPSELADYLSRFGDSRVKANVDTGNSASLGHDPDLEMDALAPHLGSVHVKDRILNGGTVPLGDGGANLPKYFHRFVTANFRGPYIMQVARGAAGDEAMWASGNRDRVLSLLAGAEDRGR